MDGSAAKDIEHQLVQQAAGTPLLICCNCACRPGCRGGSRTQGGFRAASTVTCKTCQHCSLACLHGLLCFCFSPRSPLLLQAEVGIRKQHTATIADDIRRRVEADLKDSPGRGGPAQRKVTLCVEGNISAGKSTFLSLMKEHADLSGMIDVRVLGVALRSGRCVETLWRDARAAVVCNLHQF